MKAFYLGSIRGLLLGAYLILGVLVRLGTLHSQRTLETSAISESVGWFPLLPGIPLIPSFSTVENNQAEGIYSLESWRQSIDEQIGSNRVPSFSACLIVKDDNHWLIEWLAYHYHVLPLKHIVVVQDPTSRTSATPILDRWRQGRYMHVEEWQDDDFLPSWVNKTYYTRPAILHLNRQIHFYGKCMEHLKQRSKTWVLLTDTDEFVQVNQRMYPLPSSIRRNYGHVSQLLRLQQANQTCLHVPRLQVSSVSNNDTMIPLGDDTFNTSNFLTFRWQYHPKNAMHSGKNIVNVHKLEEVPRRIFSVHQVLEDICAANFQGRLDHPESFLVAQHYLGTFEQYTFRDDPRDKSVQDGRRSMYYERGREGTLQKEVAMQDWFGGFVDEVGLIEAQRLLADVGTVKQDWNESEAQQNDEEAFAACLVIKDDNHWLIEWLAYHYHVLPLRNLTVVRDPSSRTSPDHIWERWHGRIDIQEWTDGDFMPKWILERYRQGNLTPVLLHRHRQQFFYSACTKDFQKRGASWLLFSDTDEFIRPNSYRDGDLPSIPSLLEPGSVVKYLQEASAQNSSQPACLHVPRLQITANESDPLLVQQDLPYSWNGSNFLTTRWLYHSGKEIVFGHNLDGKNVLHVGRFPPGAVPKRAPSAHQVIPSVCPETNGGRLNHTDSLLLIHHYLGSFEQYNFRDDPRNAIEGRPKRDRSLWETAGQPATVREDVMRDWLVGFLKYVGQKEARRLLKGVGMVSPS